MMLEDVEWSVTELRASVSPLHAPAGLLQSRSDEELVMSWNVDYSPARQPSH